MTVNEQLAVIDMWTGSFRVHNAPGGRKHGVLIYNNLSSGAEYVGPCKTHADVVGIALVQVYKFVWETVMDIEG